jgi:hypothetical protein
MLYVHIARMLPRLLPAWMSVFHVLLEKLGNVYVLLSPPPEAELTFIYSHSVPKLLSQRTYSHNRIPRSRFWKVWYFETMKLVISDIQHGLHVYSWQEKVVSNNGAIWNTCIFLQLQFSITVSTSMWTIQIKQLVIELSVILTLILF